MAGEQKVRLSKVNIGIIVAFLFLAYIVYNIFVYIGKEKIYRYEVIAGSLAKTNVYEALAIREEEVKYAPETGYIDYFAREAEHVGIGDLIYTIDQSGAISDLIAPGGGQNSLTNEDLADLRKEIINFCAGYDSENFGKTYDFMYSIDGMVLKLANVNMLDQIRQINSSSDSIKMIYADETGYVVYNTDGYESVSVNGLTSELFNKDTYEKKQLISTSLVDQGSDTYKLITSDDWQLAIQLTDERAKELEAEGFVTVRFLEDRREITAPIEIVQNGTEFFGIISFNNSLPAYATERFIEIEIITQEETGLKIPLSSLVHKEFYLVPTDYALYESGEDSYYFIRKTFKEDGTLSSETVSLHIYDEIDGYYYVNDEALQIGDYLLKDSGQEEYAVAKKGELVGVYNINMGYADFRKVTIMYQNEEYAIVEKGQTYGIKQYDFIVLDSGSVDEDDFIYE